MTRDVFNQMLAVLETAKHLDLLVVQDHLMMGVTDGVAHYCTKRAVEK
jgi:hypothetical protein